MNKSEALFKFFSGFGIPAFEENSLPAGTQPPFITYTDTHDNYEAENTALQMRIWDKSNSFAYLMSIETAVHERIKHGLRLDHDNGHIFLYKGSPFAQSLSEQDNTYKGKLINIISLQINE